MISRHAFSSSWGELLRRVDTFALWHIVALICLPIAADGEEGLNNVPLLLKIRKPMQDIQWRSNLRKKIFGTGSQICSHLPQCKCLLCYLCYTAVSRTRRWEFLLQVASSLRGHHIWMVTNKKRCRWKSDSDVLPTTIWARHWGQRIVSLTELYEDCTWSKGRAVFLCQKSSLTWEGGVDRVYRSPPF